MNDRVQIEQMAAKRDKAGFRCAGSNGRFQSIAAAAKNSNGGEPIFAADRASGSITGQKRHKPGNM